MRCSAAWDHNYSSETVGTVHVLPGKGGGICSSGPLARSQLPTDKPLAGLRTGCAKLPFSFCVLLEGFASLHPQRGRPRWPAKNKPEQWKLKPKEITSESFVLLKYLQYCCSDDGQLFPFPISYSTSPYLGFTTLLLINVHGMARKEMKQVYNPLKCQDTFYISRFSVGFFGDWTLQSVILEQSWVRSSAGGSLLSTGTLHHHEHSKGQAACPLSFWWLYGNVRPLAVLPPRPLPQHFLPIPASFQLDGAAFSIFFVQVHNCRLFSVPVRSL